MEAIKNKLNFLKWQLIARLPNGSIYERVKEGILNNSLTKDNPFYYIYWLDLNRTVGKKYLLGTFQTNNSDYKDFINWLDNQYGKNGFYEIPITNGIIRIPKPREKDYKCFKAEFLDIIMPAITGEEQLSIPYLEGPYEYKDIFLKKGDIVLDLGANYGLFSALALAKGCKVFAFEPFEDVVRNYLQKIEGDITIINKAASNQTGISLFHVNEQVPSCNHLELNPFKGKDSLISVETITVDDFVEQNRLKKVDFIKADIEGAERLMIEGATETLREYAPNLALCYYHHLGDLRVLRKAIQKANPNYEIEVQYKKIYAKDRRK